MRAPVPETEFENELLPVRLNKRVPLLLIEPKTDPDALPVVIPRLSVAPDETMIPPPPVADPAEFAATSVPVLMIVDPENVLFPDKIVVPLPAILRIPDPAIVPVKDSVLPFVSERVATEFCIFTVPAPLRPARDSVSLSWSIPPLETLN